MIIIQIRKILVTSVVCLIMTFSILLLNLSAQSVPKDVEQYEIDVDDILEIRVSKPEEITNTVMVYSDGYISFPYIGQIKASGKTVYQLQREIEEALSDGYMKYPMVSVFLKESRSRKFYVYGAVNKPGTYPLEGRVTCLQAISLAGGFSKEDAVYSLKLLRPNKRGKGYETLYINVDTIMQGNWEADHLIEPKDILMVDLLKKGKFFIYGEVVNPGSYDIDDEGITILQAISMAGGFNQFESSGGVRLLRPRGNQMGYISKDIDMKSIMEGGFGQQLNAANGDIIVVRANEDLKFFVYGEVVRPGTYPLSNTKDTTILQAVSMAGGFSKFASQKVRLLRANSNKRGYEIIKININSIMEGNIGEDKVLQSGDVIVASEGML